MARTNRKKKGGMKREKVASVQLEMKGCKIGVSKVTLVSDCTNCVYITSMWSLPGYNDLNLSECTKTACDEVQSISAFKEKGMLVVDPTTLPTIHQAWHDLARFIHKALRYKQLEYGITNVITEHMIYRATMNAYGGWYYLVTMMPGCEIINFAYHCQSIMLFCKDVVTVPDDQLRQEFYSWPKGTRMHFGRNETGDDRDVNFFNLHPNALRANAESEGEDESEDDNLMPVLEDRPVGSEGYSTDESDSDSDNSN